MKAAVRFACVLGATLTSCAGPPEGVAAVTLPLECRHRDVVATAVGAGALALAVTGERAQLVFQDAGSGSLVFAEAEGDSSWRVEPLDKPALEGPEAVALAIDAGGRPHIAYVAEQAVSHLTTNAAGAGWAMDAVTPPPPGGPSLAIAHHGALGLALRAGGGLVFAESEGASWRLQVVDAGEPSHVSLSVALEIPTILWYDAAAGALRSARRIGGAWELATLLEGDLASVATLHVDGVAHAAFLEDGRVRYAARDGATMRVTTLSPSTAESLRPVLAVGDGRVHVAYAADGSLVLATLDVATGSWRHRSVGGREVMAETLAIAASSHTIHLVYAEAAPAGVLVRHARCAAP
jgi:hypothetical protein